MAGVISTDELASQLGAAELRLIDARGSFATYEEQHIPGAQMLHIETLRLCNHGVPCQMMPAELLGRIFGRLGITAGVPAVIYATRPTDQVSATYTAWSLLVTGHTRVSVLDGGLQKWMSEQRPLTQDYPAITPVEYPVAFREEIFADWRYVRDRLERPDVVLVDTRTHAMYVGEEGTTLRRGHIPGAVLHNYLYDFARDGSYRSPDQLRRRYESAGITPEKEVITYCVTGREGSAAWFTLTFLLGYPRVRLYQASLTEWAARPELPMVIGEEPWGETRRAA